MNQQHRTPCVVITGSSRGIGLGLAEAFLKLGWKVVITARNPEQLKQTYEGLMKRCPKALLYTQCCDVTDAAQLEILWHYAISCCGQVDVWINNAGSCHAAKAFVTLEADEIRKTIETNVIGTMLGSQVALRGMLKQGYGQIFNMEGWGSRGEWSAGMTPYAASKRAIDYLRTALSKETKGTPIKIGTLSPGMVATDLLIDSWRQGENSNWKKMKWLFMFVIDLPEPVCEYLASRISQNNRTNVRVVWMTPWRLLLRFLQPYYWQRNPIKGTDLDRL